MLDTPTKKRIDDCRDILVGKLPDPKAQIEQITIGLIYKFMDDMDKEAIELGGKAKFFSNYNIPDPANPVKKVTVEFEKYSWDRLFDAKVTASEMLTLYAEAIAGMDKNPNIPQLFRDIFKNAFLPYRDPETLKMFLKTIAEFEYTHSEKLGDAFEYLLSVMGSQGDAGQFRTPRHIIDFLVAVVNPGKTDTILDPACGTAGFLISAFKYITAQSESCPEHDSVTDKRNGEIPKQVRNDGKSGGLTPDERRRIIGNFTGYDISPDMVRLSLVNLYLHGFSDPHIWEYDTLSSEDRWNETFDVILANPPFMSPKGGIRPHKKFSIGSNRSEVLFVDYIAEHLNPKGRAGIIVPEGVIFQSGTAYKALRKMLVDNYLYAVVSLPAGIFNPYSGVKTSILLMDKQLAKQTDEILFVKIDNDGYGLGAQRNAVKGGQLDEAIEIIRQFVAENTVETQCIASLPTNTPPPANPIAHAVPKTEIAKNGDYNLSGERYKTTNILSTNYESVKLGDVCELFGGGTPSKTNDSFWMDGTIKWISAKHIDNFGNIIGNDLITNEAVKNSSTKVVPQDSLIFITRVSVGKYAYTKDEFAINQDLTAVIPYSKEKLDVKYLYCVAPKIAEFINLQAVGIGVRGITRQQLAEIQIPLPPLSVQQEIVAEIEGYQKIIDGAKMVVENYRPKIEIDPEWEMVELGEICEVKAGGTPSRTNSKYWDGNIPWYSSGELNSTCTIEPDEKITEFGLQNSNASIFPKGSLLVGMYDTAAFKMSILDRNATFNQAVCGIKPNNQIDLNFLMLFFLMNKEYYLKHRIGVRQRNLNKRFISDIKIPKISLEIQHRIVAQIEKEQELVSANKQLIVIFEQKIKDRIARVWGGSTGLTTGSSTELSASGTTENASTENLQMVAEPAAEYSKKAE